jgi:hypothetical protein
MALVYSVGLQEVSKTSKNNETTMQTPNLKINEIAETQWLCKEVLVGKLLDHVRLHGKKATPKNCRPYGLYDGDGNRILKVLDLGNPAPIFSLGNSGMDGPTYTNHRIYCLYVIEDEYGRQYLMFCTDNGKLSRLRIERESLLNKSLTFVSAIADIVKKH